MPMLSIDSPEAVERSAPCAVYILIKQGRHLIVKQSFGKYL